jgi:hypothetical protein
VANLRRRFGNFINLLDWAQEMMLFLRTGRSADVARHTERLAESWRAAGPREERESGQTWTSLAGRSLISVAI